jgi:hypothetical protein
MFSLRASLAACCTQRVVLQGYNHAGEHTVVETCVATMLFAFALQA